MVVTIPVEFETDHITLLNLARKCYPGVPKYSVTVAFVERMLQWALDRTTRFVVVVVVLYPVLCVGVTLSDCTIHRVLEKLVMEGIIWVDDKDSVPVYYVLPLWVEQYTPHSTPDSDVILIDERSEFDGTTPLPSV
uniref:Vacuolar-sorting protein SNF8 n=1 Tax=Lygus hesperus TaxID=30085 RepID=A0A0A9YFG0_LYGHE